MINKRERILNLINSKQVSNYVPAAFFLHFDPAYHTGQAAIEKHLEYFHQTDMDFVKIQFECKFPQITNIQKPEDWEKMPFYGLNFYAEQLEVINGLVKAARKEALVLVTLYSPFMCAMLTSDEKTLVKHIHENPQKVNNGFQVITDSLMGFVKEAIRLGVDGFYHSTMGGEYGRLQDKSLFDECIRPFDLELMQEIDRQCIFNILHICDYQHPYQDLSPFINYPGHVVNTNLQLVDRKMSAREISELFNRPYMGGMDRHGILVTGNLEEIKQETQIVLDNAPEQFILGADCTIPSETNWDNLKTAIATAHNRKSA